MAEPQVSRFYSAISAVFQGWTALQLAVAHSFGGYHSRAKAEWLIGATEQWFTENNDIDPYELEDFLSDIMSSEFNSVVDDNSLSQVSTKICRFYDLARQGKYEQLDSAISSLSKSADVSSSQRGQGSGDDDDDMDMNVDDDNVMSHMNALELSRNSGAEAMAEDGTNERENNSSPSVNNEPEEEDDGWTTVTKGGRKKQGK